MKGLIALVVFGVVLFETAGLVWLAVSAGALLIAVFVFMMLSAPAEPIADVPYDAFGPVFDDPRATAKYLKALMRVNPEKSMRLRTQQLLRDSLEIAELSKRRATVESRLKVSSSCYLRLRSDHVTPIEEMAAITEAYEMALARIATAVYINEATGILERKEKLKTEKTKTKYQARAREIIDKGLRDPVANHEQLRDFAKRHLAI